MSQAPLVSIIIPTKDRAGFLKETLKNICAQEYENLEVVIVDDHSTDETNQLIESYPDKRVMYFKNNGEGPGSARNLGLKMSKGVYVKFFDSDDFMTAGLIASQVSMIEIAQADAVYGPYVRVSKDANGELAQLDEILHFRPWKKSKELARLMLNGFFIPIPCFLFRRKFLDRVSPWVEGVVTYEDWRYLWNIASVSPDLQHSAEEAFFYLIHGNQSTGNNFSDKERDNEKATLMIPLLEGEYYNRSRSLTERFLAAANLYNEVIGLKDKRLMAKYRKHIESNKLRTINLVRRMYVKVTSLINSSNWSKHYGGTRSSMIYKNFLSKLP